MKQSPRTRHRRPIPLAGIILVQVGLLIIVAVAAAAMNPRGWQRIDKAFTGSAVSARVPVSREWPLTIEPLYDDPKVASDEELIAVLAKVRPRFSQDRLAPNYVEHALRTWGGQIEFQDPEVMDGPELVNYLTDYGAQLASFDGAGVPLIVERPDGVEINWGRQPGESVHHDHWLACLTEAGCPLDTPVYGRWRRNNNLNDVLQQALRDFDPSERETEWSVMAFGLWLAPEHDSWINGDGRRVGFNLLAERLMRGQLRFGVCGGTHRLYSLMVLLRLDDDYDILTAETRQAVLDHLRHVRDKITLSQHADGHWGSDWPDGAAARAHPIDEPHYRKVIATGHHLEWLAIAYEELHPPRELIYKAAEWLIETVKDTPQETILSQYTFYSHVGNALALWRGTHPAAAWRQTEPRIRTLTRSASEGTTCEILPL